MHVMGWCLSMLQRLIIQLYNKPVKMCDNTGGNNNKRKLVVEMQCGCWDHEAIKGLGTLKCTNCEKLIHFECTRLQLCRIFALSSSNRRVPPIDYKPNYHGH